MYHDGDQPVRDLHGRTIEIGHHATMKLPGRGWRVISGTVRSVNPNSVELWDHDASLPMFHTAHPSAIRVLT